MNKYIDADRLRAEIDKRMTENCKLAEKCELVRTFEAFGNRASEDNDILSIIDSLQQEQPMPDSTQLIAEWEKEKSMLEQKDFRGDAERMAYNAFLDGFVKGLYYRK